MCLNSICLNILNVIGNSLEDFSCLALDLSFPIEVIGFSLKTELHFSEVMRILCSLFLHYCSGCRRFPVKEKQAAPSVPTASNSQSFRGRDGLCLSANRMLFFFVIHLPLDMKPINSRV